MKPVPRTCHSHDETRPEGGATQDDRVTAVATIEYRCPTHGKVEPLDASAGVPVCSSTLVRMIAGETRSEPCGQPLAAYFE